MRNLIVVTFAKKSLLILPPVSNTWEGMSLKIQTVASTTATEQRCSKKDYKKERNLPLNANFAMLNSTLKYFWKLTKLCTLLNRHMNVWFVTRNSTKEWILQIIIGCIVMIFFLSVISVPKSSSEIRTLKSIESHTWYHKLWEDNRQYFTAVW